ncbi:hypothetical protein niasHT_035586 [Heterodera trifolii]|uniref:Uncharacterized protein n=1 Tax=Heterodera trifolii TaxID=157864 RepID=A0ABD2IEY4_9BILA
MHYNSLLAFASVSVGYKENSWVRCVFHAEWVVRVRSDQFDVSRTNGTKFRHNCLYQSKLAGLGWARCRTTTFGLQSLLEAKMAPAGIRDPNVHPRQKTNLPTEGHFICCMYRIGFAHQWKKEFGSQQDKNMFDIDWQSGTLSLTKNVSSHLDHPLVDVSQKIVLDYAC